jgi:hypothetical protein
MMALTGVAKRKVKKVQGKLKKASKAHANQSKILNLLRRRMPEQLLPRLRKSISRLRERYKFLQSVSKEQK